MNDCSMNKVIYYDSPEAACQVEATMWRSSNGRLFFDEHSARYDGSTDRICPDCGAPYKTNAYCEPCSDRKRQARFNALESREWDGIAPLCIFDDDTFFFDVDSLAGWLEEQEGCSIEDVPLVFCDPVCGPVFGVDDFSDYLPEEGKLPDSIWEAVENLNQVIKDAGPLCWFPGKVRAIVRDLDTDYRRSDAREELL